MNKRQIVCKIKALEKKLTTRDISVDEVGSYLTGGSVIGTTLVLTQTEYGTVNIPMDGFAPDLDLDNLTDIQCAALAQCIRGDLVCDAFNESLGYLIEL